MRTVRLGTQLALTGGGRLRSLVLIVSCVVVVVVTLGAASAVHALLAQSMDIGDDTRLAAVCLIAITVPLTVLVMTVARLSATLRDRRLAGLRLIGLTPTQTRLVAATESGVAAVVGTLAGYAVFWLVRPELARVRIAGLTWQHGYVPDAIDQALVLALTPAVAAMAAAAPVRTRPDAALAAARRADRRPPRIWRAIPVLCGGALCLAVVRRWPRPLLGNDQTSFPWFVAGVVLLGVGILLVVPVFVRFTAAALNRSDRPSIRIAARRLDAQPAGVTRLVAVLLLGLFVATGARFVVAAWDGLEQTAGADDSLHRRQLVGYQTTAAQAAGMRARIAGVPGVTATAVLPVLESRFGYQAVVATCADLVRLQIQTSGCREGRTYRLWTGPGRLPTAWSRAGDKSAPILARTAEHLPLLGSTGQQGSAMFAPIDQFAVLLPPSTVGHLPSGTSVFVAATSGPGRDLGQRITDAGVSTSGAMYLPDFSAYDLAVRLRTLVWTIAGLILALGLFTFGVSSIDRVSQRRREMTALRLVGIPAATLWRAQWIEAAVPIATGSVLAIGLGGLGGASYLIWGDDVTPTPWHQAGAFALVALGAASVVATVTALAGSARIRPDEIRSE